MPASSFNVPIQVVRSEVWIPGPMPGMNEIIALARRNRYASAGQKKQWTQRVAFATAAAKVPQYKWATFEFEWVEPNRKRDPDNIASARKFILDGLQQASALEGDGWFQIRGWSDRFRVTRDKGDSPGVRVVLVGELA